MRTYILTQELFIRKPLPEVFSFFDRPENLAVLTPEKLDFKILTPAQIKMKVSAIIDYTIKIFGISFHRATLITTYEPPYCFIDEQLKGPFAYWHHQHTFSDYNGGTIMTDTVHYALPLGFLGRIAHWLFVKRQIKYLFDYRTKKVNDLFAK
jgi:ligand-binding SRPBCC domain-containing protein